jgi:predicted ATPase/DNA-binding XRE family transcriptional regulator
MRGKIGSGPQGKRESGGHAAVPPFDVLLRRFRRRSGLTQEELAEKAHLSARGINDLERGVRRTPHKTTVDLVADALEITGTEREHLRLSVGRRGKRAGTEPGNLPAPLTSFVGRQHELVDLRDRLLDDDVRLLTLTGGAGIGKSRLALELARGVQNQFADGVWHVRLAALNDASEVAGAIAETVARGVGNPFLARGDLIGHLRSRRLLLVLDDFEHVADASPVVADLLRECPGVKVLVTSRMALRLAGEHMQEVPPLSLPDANVLPGQDAGSARQSEAVQLFIQRARAIDRQFGLTEENAGVLAEICRGLDGLPLAIELAAAHIRLLSPQEILARLDRPLELLRSESREDPSRRRTLRSTLEWSYHLLGERERGLFARLAVFAGGCDLDAVEAICGDDADTAADIIERLSVVVDSSLLTARDDDVSGRRRFGMLRTVRAFADETLRADDLEYAKVRRLHANHYLHLAGRAADELLGPDQSTWYRTLEVEHANVRAALAWARECREPELGLRLAGALWRSWEARGQVEEGLTWLTSFLRLEVDVPDPVRVEALIGAGMLACAHGDDDRAETFLKECLRLSLSIGDGGDRALNSLGVVAMRRGDYASAERHYERSLALAREAGDDHRLAIRAGNLGITKLYKGDLADAKRILRENLGRSRRLGMTQEIADTLSFLGFVDLYGGHFASAERLLDESLRVARESGNVVCTIESTRGLGCVQLACGRTAKALDLLRRALGMACQRGDVRRVVRGLDALGSLASERGDRSMAIGLWMAADRARSEFGVVEHPVERSFHEPWRLRLAAGDALRRAARLGGQAMSIDDAVACALKDGS